MDKLRSVLPQGLRLALGEVIATERQAWRREKAEIVAEAREAMAQMRREFDAERLAMATELREARAELRELRDAYNRSPLGAGAGWRGGHA